MTGHGSQERLGTLDASSIPWEEAETERLAHVPHVKWLTFKTTQNRDCKSQHETAHTQVRYHSLANPFKPHHRGEQKQSVGSEREEAR